MRKHFAAVTKRALAFSLALALLFVLFPAIALTANAAHTGTWTYKSGYSWLSGAFTASDTDRVYTDTQSYDWTVSITPTKTPPSSAKVVATIQDAQGNQVDSYTRSISGLKKGVTTVLCSHSNFPNLTTSLAGTFTLTVEMKIGTQSYATLVQTFSREITSSLAVTVSSRSNPDKVFTFADPIDLVVNIKKLDGIGESFQAAITITKGSSTQPLIAKGLSLPASTNTTLILKDLVDIPSITTAGAYNVNLALLDESGVMRYRESTAFAVVDIDGSLTASITSASNPDFIFEDNQSLDLMLNLGKTDGIAETVQALITVKTASGTVASSQTLSCAVPATGTKATALNLSGLPVVGTFILTAVVTDDAGNQRASVTVPFARTNDIPMTCTLSDSYMNNVGNIYSAKDEVYMPLSISHLANAGQVVRVVCSGTLNDAPWQVSKPVTLSGNGSATVTINDSYFSGYGFYKDITVSVRNSAGLELWRATDTYSFTRVLSTINPGDLPLLNINDHFTNNTGDPAIKLQLAAQAGNTMWRSSVPWQSVEISEGYFSMPDAVDDVVSITNQVGMEPMIILAYGNDRLYGQPNPDDPTWLAAYANYCYKIAEYFGDQVTYYEVWNEWNAEMGKVPVAYRGGEYYAKVLVAASAAIKRANPNAKVIGGAVAGDIGATDWIEALLNYPGAMDAMDGFSYHTYATDWKTGFFSPTEHNYPTRCNYIRDLLNIYGANDSKEIWLTETGWSTAMGVGVTEKQQAAYMVQLYAWSLAHPDLIDRLFWYDLMNDSSDLTLPESNWGVITNHESSAPYNAKKSYVAMCAMGSLLAGAHDPTTLSLGTGIYAYQFEKNGHYITVAWTESGSKTLNATFNGTMTVTDIYGNASTYSGSAALNLSETPVYLEYGTAANPQIG